MAALAGPQGRLVAALAGFTLALVPAGASGASVQPGTTEGAELVKTGWWWVVNDTPLDQTVLAPPQPPSPTVPDGTLPVSAVAGEPEKFTALEFRLDGAGGGGVVEQATLVLKETGQPGATANAEAAKILACPVTESYWADGKAAAWQARPAYDCDLASAPGERDATGVWTFDLTAVAALWTTEGYVGSTSVALVEAVDPPESFQVVYDGPKADGVGFAFTVSGGSTTGSTEAPVAGDAAAGGTAPPSGQGAAPVSSTGPATTSGGAGAAGSLSTGTGTAAGALTAAPAALPAGDAAAPAVAPAAAPGASTMPVSATVAAPAWYSGLPTGGLLLLPLALGLAYLMMLALGPDAEPAPAAGQHGVTRALERLRTAGGAMGNALTRRGGQR